MYFIDIDLFEDKLDYNGEKEFEKENPVQKLQRKLCLVKEPYHGQVYNGRQLNKIFHHLDLLTTDFCVPKHLECFVTCLENLQLLHEGVSGVKLDPNYKNLIDNFMDLFDGILIICISFPIMKKRKDLPRIFIAFLFCRKRMNLPRIFVASMNS